MKIAKLIICGLLFLTLAACATAYDKRGVYHKVRGGESIWKVARYYHVPVQDLAEWNNIEDASEVREGLKLYIPSNKDEGTPSKRSVKDEKASKSAFDAPIQFDRARFLWPVDGNVLSQFGIRNGKRHDGMDIKALSGTPIMSAANGKVVFAGSLKGYGNMLIVKHADRFFTVYAHNSKNKVKKGQKVEKGQVIGYVGATGRATGPHLHFEVREGQKARNPSFFLAKTPSHKGAEVVKVAEVKKRDKVDKEVKGTPKAKDVKAEPKAKEVKSAKNAPADESKKLSKREKMMEELKAKKK